MTIEQSAVELSMKAANIRELIMGGYGRGTARALLRELAHNAIELNKDLNDEVLGGQKLCYCCDIKPANSTGYCDECQSEYEHDRQEMEGQR